jgi:predicted nucleic acid-binding protein
MAFNMLATEQLLSNAIVVDNSVMMRWLFNDGSEKDTQYAQKVLNHIEVHKLKVIVPYLWVYEASFVVNFYVKKAMISHKKSIKHLESLFDLCLVIRGEETPKDLFIFASMYKLSTYDTSYVMLAMQQKASIATLDKEIVKVSENIDLNIFS